MNKDVDLGATVGLFSSDDIHKVQPADMVPKITRSLCIFFDGFVSADVGGLGEDMLLVSELRSCLQLFSYCVLLLYQK
jgi:hypothetical protein